MVGVKAAVPRERIATLINSARSVDDLPLKLDRLRRLSDVFYKADSVLLCDFFSPLLDFVSDGFSPVRKLAVEMIGHVGLKRMEYIPEVVPVLIDLLKDDTPAVARQAIRCGIDIFSSTLFQIAVRGLYSSDLDSSLEPLWAWMLKLRDEIYLLAFQETDGRRLLALKFIESVVLLYTPDPNGSSQPPPDLNSEGSIKDFNISWLRGGHPVLNVGDLSVEASQGLGLLLDQLSFPAVKSHNNLVIIVLINSLSAIASRRPSFYGRILPVLLALDSSISEGKGIYHALKNAYLLCVNCTHVCVAPWRDRLNAALRGLLSGGESKQSINQVVNNDESIGMTVDDQKPSSTGVGSVDNSSTRKRTGEQDNGKLVDDEMSGKRARLSPAAASEGSTNELKRDHALVPSSGPETCKATTDNGPVQQLVAMFGALAAQGEKAAASLEILISSISADLLAEVVMANMQNISSHRPQINGDEESLFMTESQSSAVGSHAELTKLSSLLTNIFSDSSVEIAGTETQPSASTELELSRNLDDSGVPGSSQVDAGAQVPKSISVSSPGQFPSAVDDAHPEIASEVMSLETVDEVIPGLDLSRCSEALVAPALDSSRTEDADQEQGANIERDPVELLSSVSTDRFEEHSPKAAIMDISSSNFSSTTSVLTPQLILPKMVAPVVNLSDEQKDNVQKQVFVRIIDAFKQIEGGGGSHVCRSVLAYLAVEFPLDLDPWKVLQTHILSDYVNHEGHELTLGILYRLYGVAEEERDFLSSTTATSVYETFLLTLAEGLRDTFPASDKSLSRLLVEIPYLPKSILELLESLCSPGMSDKDVELQSGDRVTQGLSIVWSLILLRPSIRDACLKIALQSAVHYLEEVRNKAIRLVANKLYPLASISQQIEEFAQEMLSSVANLNHQTESSNSGPGELQKGVTLESASTELSQVQAELSSQDHPHSSSENISSASIVEVQRCVALYFALCTKKHSLFRQVFVICEKSSKAVKQVVLQQIPMLVRTIGPSAELLNIISDPPAGRKELLMQVLHTLTDGTVPSSGLLSTIKKLYDTKIKDVDILILILPFLPKDEVLGNFRHLVNAPLEKFQIALSCILQGSSHRGSVISPEEALIAIHGIDPERDAIPLKKVTEACNTCFEQRDIFTQQVLAKVLNQLVEQIPLPLLFMRTVMQAIGAFPLLVDFIMEILSRLISKQIWKYPKLWVGFMKCALLTKPQSFGVLLKLPPTQLETVLNKMSALREPLAAYASQPNIKSTLPRSVLLVLGIASDQQSSGQTKSLQSTQTEYVSQPDQTAPSHAQSGDASKSDKEVDMEKPKESSDAS